MAVLGSWTTAAMLAAVPLGGRSKDAERPVRHASVPVRIYGGFLVVVEGQIGGVSQRQNFVVDTGTSPSILSLRVARELGLPLSQAHLAALGRDSTLQATSLPELDLGPLQAKAAHFLVADLSEVERNWKVPIAGILGLDILGKQSFRLDYEERVLEFGDVSQDGIAVNFSGEPNLAIAGVSIRGNSYHLLVDTGADRLVLFGNKPADSLVSSSDGAALPGNGVTGGVPVRAIPRLDLDWNGEHFRKDAVLIPDRQEPLFDGLLSVRALGFRAIAFDAERQVVHLQR